MNRLLAGVVMLAIALGSSPGQGKARRASLDKKQCFLICARIMECAGMAHQSSTLAETAICADDCVFESKDKERWPVAVRLQGQWVRCIEGLQCRWQDRTAKVSGWLL